MSFLKFFKQSLQYHLPLGIAVRPTHSKWNHSFSHFQKIIIFKNLFFINFNKITHLFSHSIIVPYETFWINFYIKKNNFIKKIVKFVLSGNNNI